MFLSSAIWKYVCDCLQLATISDHRKIAFPALGTGNLEYDKAEVAHSIFQAIQDFSQIIPYSSVTDIILVIFPSDTDTFDAFQTAFKEVVGGFKSV